MENETEVIKQQMTETRTALSEKLEAVEDLVTSTVQETTQTVSDTVSAVSDTVENTVNTVSESVESVKDALDITQYVEQYPWLVMGGCFALGYTLGSMLPSPADRSAPPSYEGPEPYPYEPERPAYTAEPAAAERGGISSFLGGWQPVIDKLKGLAIGTAAGVVGEMLRKNLPDNLTTEVTSILDDTTRNLGGTVLHSRS